MRQLSISDSQRRAVNFSVRKTPLLGRHYTVVGDLSMISPRTLAGKVLSLFTRDMGAMLNLAVISVI